jgi:hypothetical protein
MQRSEMRRVQRSQHMIKSKAKERRRSVKVSGISKARLKPLKRRSGTLGFSTKARGIEIRPFYWVCKRALIILTPPYNFAL